MIQDDEKDDDSLRHQTFTPYCSLSHLMNLGQSLAPSCLQHIFSAILLVGSLGEMAQLNLLSSQRFSHPSRNGRVISLPSILAWMQGIAYTPQFIL